MSEQSLTLAFNAITEIILKIKEIHFQLRHVQLFLFILLTTAGGKSLCADLEVGHIAEYKGEEKEI